MKLVGILFLIPAFVSAYQIECALNQTSQSNSVDLVADNTFSLCNQACTQWCWATTLSSVITYVYNQPTICLANECTLASELAYFRFGAVINCCAVGCNAQACNQPAQPSEMTFLLAQHGVGTQFSGVVAEAFLINQLSNNLPLILGYLDLEGGHVVMLYAYNNGIFSIHDPFTGSTFTGGYNALSTFGTKTWTMTFSSFRNVQACPVTTAASSSLQANLFFVVTLLLLSVFSG